MPQQRANLTVDEFRQALPIFLLTVDRLFILEGEARGQVTYLWNRLFGDQRIFFVGQLVQKNWRDIQKEHHGIGRVYRKKIKNALAKHHVYVGMPFSEKQRRFLNTMMEAYIREALLFREVLLF